MPTLDPTVGDPKDPNLPLSTWTKATLWSTAAQQWRAATRQDRLMADSPPGAGPPPHGLSSNTLALTTMDCDAMRSLRTKCP